MPRNSDHRITELSHDVSTQFLVVTHIARGLPVGRAGWRPVGKMEMKPTSRRISCGSLPG